MPKQSDIDYKSFITAIGKLIDARLKTQAVITKADTEAIVKASEKRLKAELASKEDIKDMATKQDIARLEQDITQVKRDMATKQDLTRLEGKLVDTKPIQKQVDELKRRLDQMEEELMSLRSKN